MQLNEQWIWLAFKQFDVDNSGTITADNLVDAFKRLGRNYDSEAIREMIREVDLENNGIISFEEFKAMLA